MKVREGSGGPPGGPGGVGRYTLSFGRGQEAIPEVREGSGGTPRGTGRVLDSPGG